MTALECAKTAVSVILLALYLWAMFVLVAVM